MKLVIPEPSIAQATPSPSNRSGWGWTILLTFCLAMTFVHRGMLSVLVEPIEQELSLTDLQMGEIQGPAFVLLFSVASVAFGRGADVGKRRGLLIASLIVWLCGALAIALAGSFLTLVAGRMLVGAGTAAIMPLGASLISDYFRGPKLGMAFGVFMAGAVFGDAMAVVVSEGFLAVIDPHTAPFGLELTPWREVVLWTVIPLLVFLCIVPLLNEPNRAPAPEDVANMKRRASFSFLLMEWRLYLPYALAMTAASIAGAATYWVPEVLRREFGMTANDLATGYGGTLTVSSLIGAGLGITTGRLAANPTRGFVITAIAYGGSAASLLFFLSDHSTWCMAAIGLYVVIDATTAVLLMTSIQSVTPPRLRGITAALDRIFAVSIGYSIGQPLVGWLADRFNHHGLGLRGAMIVVAIPATIIAALLLLLAGVEARRDRC